ncbi:MAG: cobalamin biosynthesis protein CbiG, partial [Aquificota bacterium]|nr:cobalamin biosynthesis protein CbiG [Aquificota bacterium]
MPQSPKPLVIFYLRDRGRKLAERLADYFPHVRVEKYSREKVAQYWPEARALVFIMACGVAVRAIASLLSDKKTDPAVVVLDETGKFAVSLLSGHLGGANELAREIAALLGGEAVVTTASDLAGLPALDLWAETYQLVLEPEELVPEVTARYLNRKTLKVFLDYPVPIPDTWKAVDHPEEADLVVSYRNVEAPKTSLSARPRVLFLGIGL